MFEIYFNIHLFIALIELEHPLKISNKKTKWFYLLISLIKVEHPLKT